jgi:hypothetical protein
MQQQSTSRLTIIWLVTDLTAAFLVAEIAISVIYDMTIYAVSIWKATTDDYQFCFPDL